MEHSVGAETFQGDDAPMTAVAQTEPRPRDLAAFGAALVTVVFWASAFVGIRSAGKTFAPGALSLGRLVVAATVLATVLAVRGERLPRRAELRAVGWPLLLCGVLW